MTFFIILGEFLAERLVPLIAPGFPPEQVALAAHLTRIVLPAQIFFYLGGLLMAIQFTRNRFLLPALAPLVYNAGIIVGGLALGPFLGMSGFAWGVLGGSFVGNFVLQLYGARRAGLVYSPGSTSPTRASGTSSGSRSRSCWDSRSWSLTSG